MDQKLNHAIKEFEEALLHFEQGKENSLVSDALAKRFEISLEYALEGL